MSDATGRIEHELIRLVRRVRVRTLSNLGTIHPQLEYGPFLFLVSIVDAPHGARGSELAEELGVHKSTASRAVASLERLGLVRREPDPDDGRAHLLVAEPVAAERVSAYRASSHERLEGILDDWDDADTGAFADMLERFNEIADVRL